MNARQTARKFAPSGQMQIMILAIISYINEVIKFRPTLQRQPQVWIQGFGREYKVRKVAMANHLSSETP